MSDPIVDGVVARLYGDDRSDFDVMRESRLKWVRECAAQNLPMPSEQALAAYHRGFLDALEASSRKCEQSESA